MAKLSTVQRRDDERYGVRRRGGGAEADSFENELGERAAVTDAGHRSRFRAGVAEAAALGRMSRGDAMKAFSRFDELTTTGTYSNKAPMSAAGQRSAGDRQSWWERASKTFGHTGFGGAREPGVGVFGGEKAAPAANPAVAVGAAPAASPAVAVGAAPAANPAVAGGAAGPASVDEGTWWDRSSATFGHAGFGGAREPGVGVFGGEKAAPGFGNKELNAFADRMDQFIGGMDQFIGGVDQFIGGC